MEFVLAYLIKAWMQMIFTLLCVKKTNNNESFLSETQISENLQEQKSRKGVNDAEKNNKICKQIREENKVKIRELEKNNVRIR